MELIEKLEAATEGSRKLDAEVHAIPIGLPHTGKTTSGYGYGEHVVREESVPHYTTNST